ncbi:hypothetical protein [Corynebacterium halotolerans]|uniref:hypothetical protein n=1 Tax=Corynebacterium halotolerans TaxID=225326 RepID=UPI003CF14258
MKTLVGGLWPSAAVCWGISLLAFVAAAGMALDGWDTNIGAGFALLIAMLFAAVAQLLTLGELLAWAISRIRNRMAEPFPPLRKLLWSATAVTALASVMLLATGWELDSLWIVHLSSSAVITGIAAGAVSVDDRHLLKS